MADWKYIMCALNEGTDKQQLVPIIFPNHLVHSDMARQLHRVTSDNGRRAAPVVSAGFISGLAVTAVHGMSESLGDLESKPTDASIMNMMPYEAGRPSVLPDVEKLLLMRMVQHLMDRIEELDNG